MATCPAVSQIFRLIMVPSTTMRFARYVPPIVPEACASGLRAGGVRVYPRSARIARTRKGGHMHACTRKRRIPACRCTCPGRSAAAAPSAQPGHQQPLAQHPFAQPGARRNNAAAPPITFPTPLSPTATTLRAMQSPSIFSPCTIVDGRPPGYPGASSTEGGSTTLLVCARELQLLPPLRLRMPTRSRVRPPRVSGAACGPSVVSGAVFAAVCVGCAAGFGNCVSLLEPRLECQRHSTAARPGSIAASARDVPPETRQQCGRVAAVLFRGGGGMSWDSVRSAQQAQSCEERSGEYAPSGATGPTDFATRGVPVRKAALEGDTRAQHSLGLLHWGGYGGVVQSDALSAKWHAAAAAGGNWDAVAVLGGCLRKGVGVSQDEVLGIRLIHQSAAAGSPAGLIKKGGPARTPAHAVLPASPRTRA